MSEKMEHEAVFKFVPGYERLYSATSDGRIYRHAREKQKGGFIAERRNTQYSRIPLWKNGMRTWHAVHRLVAQTFIPNPKNKPQVNHKNFNRHDNSLDNLEWMTRRENWEHARDHGKYKGIMLSEEEQFEVYSLYSSGEFTSRQLAKKFGVSTSSVYRHIQRYRNVRLAA